jgi:beta-galactosidase
VKRRAFVQGMTAAGAAALGGKRGRRHPLGGPATGAAPAGHRRVERLDTGWRFLRDDPPDAASPALDDSAWERATLPHTARVEALVTGVGSSGSPDAQWQGICWYRRKLRLEPGEAGRRVLLRFEGAMNVAEVWLDGERLGGHLGGWLPFVLDLTGRLAPGRDHQLAVRLDNRDDPVTGPKPLAQLDFNMYGGLYRPVYLIRTDPLRITDPILAARPASGGVFVTYPRAGADAATVRVQVHVANAYPEPRTFRVRATLHAPGDQVVAAATSGPRTLASGSDEEVVQELEVRAPALWSPGAPNLHTLACEVVTDAGTVDAQTLRIGIRRLEIAPGRFSINGETMFLRGTNRHQEYPYVGYALSDAAQYRDARKIKEAGFDFIRLSHYAHAPAFMDACDELGLVVMDCIPGWQFFNRDPAFAEVQYRNCQDLLRRDRNHACVALWEVSLNESWMPPEFLARTRAIAHEEYPGDQCFTAGWMRGYDVFLQARQHGGCHHETNDACIVDEYGDWEYYAMNAGLDRLEGPDAGREQQPAAALAGGARAAAAGGELPGGAR